MPLPSFTVSGNLFDILGDIAASELDPVTLNATVTFTSNVPTGNFVTWAGELYKVSPVVAQVDGDGSLHRGGETVKLLANDPGLNVQDLQWQVEVRLPGPPNPRNLPNVYRGPVMTAFWFDAGDDGETVDLATVAQVPSATLQPVLVSGITQSELLTQLADSGSPISEAVNSELLTQLAERGSPISEAVTEEIASFTDIIDRSKPRAALEAFCSFADKTDGAPPTVLDSGHAATVTQGTGSAGTLAVDNGDLVFTSPTAGADAAYYKATLDGDGTRIGARWIWDSTGSTDLGVVALAICRTPILGAPTGPPTMSLHLVISPTFYEIGVWNGPDEPGGDGLVSLATGSFRLMTNLAAAYECEAWINGTTVWIEIRDEHGTVLVADNVTDARIGTYGGPYVFWESMGTDCTTDHMPRISHIWASSGTAKPPSHSLTVGATGATAGDGSKTLTQNTFVDIHATDLDTTFVAPPSGIVAATVVCTVHIVTAALIAVKPVVSNVDGTAWDTYDFVGADTTAAWGAGTYPRLVFHQIVTGLDPGTVYDMQPQIFTTQADTDLVINAGNIAYATVIPM